MDQKDQSKQTQEAQPQPKPRRPNDTGVLQIDGFVKIFDPNTKEVFVEKRA